MNVLKFPTIATADVVPAVLPLRQAPFHPARAEVSAARTHSIHGDRPCRCYDDGERHVYLRARDLLAAGRAEEMTDDEWEALWNAHRAVPKLDPEPF